MYKNVFLNIFKFRKKPPVPEGGQLSITAGGMTEGHGTCGQPIVGRKRPQRGRTTSSLAPVRPLLLPLHLETSLNELVNGC